MVAAGPLFKCARGIHPKEINGSDTSLITFQPQWRMLIGWWRGKIRRKYILIKIFSRYSKCNREFESLRVPNWISQLTREIFVFTNESSWYGKVITESVRCDAGPAIGCPEKWAPVSERAQLSMSTKPIFVSWQGYLGGNEMSACNRLSLLLGSRSTTPALEKCHENTSKIPGWCPTVSSHRPIIWKPSQHVELCKFVNRREFFFSYK